MASNATVLTLGIIECEKAAERESRQGKQHERILSSELEIREQPNKRHLLNVRAVALNRRFGPRDDRTARKRVPRCPRCRDEVSRNRSSHFRFPFVFQIMGRM